MSQRKRKIEEILYSMMISVLCTCVRILKDIMNGCNPNLRSMALYVLFLSIVTVPFLFFKKRKRKSSMFVIFMTFALVALDQLIKVIVYRQGEFEIELISKGLSLKPSYNRYHTAMLSFLQWEIDTVVIVCEKILVGLIMIVGIHLMIKKFKSIEDGTFLLILFCSGVFCSWLDSLAWGYTLDYIRFPFYTVIDLKDIYMVIGGNLFVVYVLRVFECQKDRKGKKSPST